MQAQSHSVQNDPPQESVEHGVPVLLSTVDYSKMALPIYAVIGNPPEGRPAPR